MRPSYSSPGCFAPCGDRDGDGDAYIARPVAEDAARERVVEAARALVAGDWSLANHRAFVTLSMALAAIEAPAQGGEATHA